MGESAEQYVKAQVSAGRTLNQIRAEFQTVGWPYLAIEQVFRAVHLPAPRVRGLALVITSTATGALSVALSIGYFAFVFGRLSRLGAREFMSRTGPLGTITVLWLLLLAVLSAVTLVLLISHRTQTRNAITRAVLDRDQRALIAHHRRLVALSWVFFAVGLTLAALALVVVGILFVSLGSICGEAVSPSCGL